MPSREDQKQYFCNAAIILREDKSSVSETDFDLDSDLAVRSESMQVSVGYLRTILQ